MNAHEFFFADTTLTALPSGALWWGERGILTVSDLHLGKSDRIARRGGQMLPPFDVHDTLLRLEHDIRHTNASTVICLGDSFDDLAAAESLTEEARFWIKRLQVGRSWIWIEGNHDAGLATLGGTHLVEFTASPLIFRHIASISAKAEISGHYHPKATLHSKGRAITRRCFLYDKTRVILPAYGTYTGGLQSTSEALEQIMQVSAMAILTGPNPVQIPMPRHHENRDSTAS